MIQPVTESAAQPAPPVVAAQPYIQPSQPLVAAHRAASEPLIDAEPLNNAEKIEIPTDRYQLEDEGLAATRPQPLWSQANPVPEVPTSLPPTSSPPPVAVSVYPATMGPPIPNAKGNNPLPRLGRADGCRRPPRTA